MQNIKFAPDLFKLVKEGRKTSTVRNGVRNYTIGPVQFVTDPPDKNDRVRIRLRFITKVELKTLKELTVEDAMNEYCHNVEQLIDRLKQIYPEINDDSEVTVVTFR